jgi:hypothetical protein
MAPTRSAAIDGDGSGAHHHITRTRRASRVAHTRALTGGPFGDGAAFGELRPFRTSILTSILAGATRISNLITDGGRAK